MVQPTKVPGSAHTILYRGMPVAVCQCSTTAEILLKRSGFTGCSVEPTTLEHIQKLTGGVPSTL